MIPDPLNPAVWNQFSYVYRNPVNYTDSTGAFIDTLLDLYDLKNNLENCLGDSDALACYMTPVSLAAVALPGLTGSGFADNAVRQADGAGIDIARRAKFIGKREGGFAGNITKADIVDDLSTGTSQSKRIAQAIQNGDIGIKLLSEKRFEKAFHRYKRKGVSIDPDDVDAFSHGRQIYLRRDNGILIFRDTVHEGTHVLDFLNSKIDWKNELLMEKRAYFYEHFFQFAKGRPSDFDNLIDILDQIKKNY